MLGQIMKPKKTEITGDIIQIVWYLLPQIRHNLAGVMFSAAFVCHLAEYLKSHGWKFHKVSGIGKQCEPEKSLLTFGNRF